MDHMAGCQGLLVEVLTVKYRWWKDISSIPSLQAVSWKNMNRALILQKKSVEQTKRLL